MMQYWRGTVKVNLMLKQALNAPRWYTALEQASTQNPNSSCELSVRASSSAQVLLQCFN